MKIKERMKNLNVDTFLYDYLKLNGIENVESYLNPTVDMIENPSNYDNITACAELITEHVARESKFFIALHVDMDSMLSNATLYKYLKGINSNLDIFVSFPTIKRQGFNQNVMKEIKEQMPNIVIMVDAGSSDKEEINELVGLGIDVVVIDHHELALKSKSMIEYPYLVNNQTSPNVINKYGSGCMVLWKLLCHVDYMNGMDDANNLISLPAISILSDVCNVTSPENRFMLQYGLNNGDNPLVVETINKLGRTNGNPITPNDWSWGINSSWNGCIKSGEVEYIKAIFYGLTEPSANAEWMQGTIRSTNKKGTNLDRALYYIRNKSKEKKEKVANLFETFRGEIDETQKVIMVFSEGRIPEMLGGDISGKVSGEYNKPALAFMDCNDDYYTGSLRSPVPLKGELQKSELFEFVEGHDSSCGFMIKKSNIEALKAYVSTLNLASETSYDVVKSYSDKTIPYELFELVDVNMMLFGKGCEVPTFHFKFKVNSKDIIEMKNRAIKIFYNDIEFVKFFVKEDLLNKLDIKNKREIEIECIGKLGINEYMGRVNYQVIMSEVEVSECDKQDLTWEYLFG